MYVTNMSLQVSSWRKHLPTTASFFYPSPSFFYPSSARSNHDTCRVAVGFAGYSILRKLWTDGTLRLYRSRGHNQASAPEHTKP